MAYAQSAEYYYANIRHGNDDNEQQQQKNKYELVIGCYRNSYACDLWIVEIRGDSQTFDIYLFIPFK